MHCRSAVIAYFVYGSTLIDITSEESINENLAVDPEQPITILATAENGDYFGILYSDPTDGDDSAFHFRYITKSKLYKNKYHNLGGYSLFYGDYLCYSEVNTDEENRTTSEVLFTVPAELQKAKKTAVYSNIIVKIVT